MKTIKTLVYTILFISLATSCNSDDDGFYNSEYVSIPNLVEIETQPTYAVNDYLYLKSFINRLQDESNQTTQLDLRKSTGNASSFNFTYLLERKVGADWELVTVTESTTDVVSGRLFTGGFYAAYADFDIENDQYEFEAGIKLENTGEYRLSFGYNSGDQTAVELRSDSVGNNIFLNIKSDQNDIDSNGYYTFTVN